jgi:hypothetical protein
MLVRIPAYGLGIGKSLILIEAISDWHRKDIRFCSLLLEFPALHVMKMAMIAIIVAAIPKISVMISLTETGRC